MTHLDLYSWNTPNGQKIVIALEEVNASYTYHAIDITSGEQHTPAFRKLSPDGKIPALVSNSTPALTYFESGAILLFLADEYPSLDGTSATEKAAARSWTFWQVGQLGPLAGQFGRFHGLQPKNDQAIEHFTQLVWRCLEVMEKRLSACDYLAGDRFTIADIACIPWIASPQSYLQRYAVDWREKCPAINRWSDQLHQRQSVVKAFGLD